MRSFQNKQNRVKRRKKNWQTKYKIKNRFWPKTRLKTFLLVTTDIVYSIYLKKIKPLNFVYIYTYTTLFNADMQFLILFSAQTFI